MIKKTEKEINKEGYLSESHHYFHLRDTAGQERDFHFHEFDKIVILLSGRVDYAVENEIFDLNPWDLLLIKHHTIHKAVIDKSVPYERVIIYLNEAYFAGIMPEAGLTRCLETADEQGRRLLVPDSAQRAAISDLLKQYELCAESVFEGSGAMKDTVIMQLLIRINGIATKNHRRSAEVYDEKIERVMSYINANLASDLTVKSLSETAYMSRYHFMRTFRESTGTTVHAYVRQRRLMNASRLIREGVPAAQAAVKSGFDDYSVFYRAFKETFGVSPARLK